MAAHARPRVRACGGKKDEIARIADRQVAEQDLVGHRKDGGVRSDAECERQRRHAGEPGIAAQEAYAVTAVAEEVPKPAEGPHVAATLFHLLDAAEGQPRLAPGFLRLHSLGDQILGEPVEVGLQLLVEILLLPFAPPHTLHFYILTDHM